MIDVSQSEERDPSPFVVAPAVPAPACPSISSSSPSIDLLLQAPSVSSALPPLSPSLRKERRLIEQCKLYHRLLCSMRRTCELSSRPNAPHPLEINEQECPYYPATINVINAATNIALTAILEFAGNMFPEFSQLSREEKWNLAVSFYYRYQAFDSCFRADKMFPNDLDKFMHEIVDRMARPGRMAIARANPDSDEFHAVLVILFWFTDGTHVRDEIVHIGERYRAAVLQELHTYYRQVFIKIKIIRREDLGMKDNAKRVGELFMLILHFERNKDIKEHFEICGILGVVKDDTFMYQLQKTSTS